MTNSWANPFTVRHRNVWGGWGILKRGKDGQVYSIPRKKYTRTHPYPMLQLIGEKIVPIRHIPAHERERTAIIKLRNFGYPIQHLASALGRSTSFIFKTLQEAKALHLLKDRIYDQRKCPRRARLYMTRRKLKTCLTYIKLWESFILGEGEEPP